MTGSLSQTRGRPELGGKWIACHVCDGHGVVSIYSARDFEGPGECRKCNGGRIWRYPSGALALFPGGPFVGLDARSLSPADDGGAR